MGRRDIWQVQRTGGSPEQEQLLRSRTQLATFGADDLDRLSADLLSTMSSYSICVGLASTQIGVPLRVAIVRRSDADPLVLINPEVTATSGKKDSKRESCMSIWGLCGEVERRDKVRVRYQDRSGASVEEQFHGFESRVVQHEIDHLDGVLYDERLNTDASLESIDIFAGLTPQASDSGVS